MTREKQVRGHVYRRPISATLDVPSLDADGWLDILGSGRLRMRKIVKLDEEQTRDMAKPRNGQEAVIDKQGKF